MNISHRLQRSSNVSGATKVGFGMLVVTGLGLLNTAQAADSWATHVTPARQTAIAACTLLTDIERVGDEYIAVGDRGIIVKASVADVQASIDSFNPGVAPNCGFDEDKEVRTDANGNKLEDENGNLLYKNASTPSAFDPLCICHTVHEWEPSEGDPDYYRYNNPEWRIWKQIESPTQSLLTAVTFADEKNGWAVGHDAIILNTTDGGNNWKIQRVNPKGLILPSEHQDEEAESFPVALLDVKFFNQNRGMAIGAFGLLLMTDDGGKNWTQVYLGEDGDFEFHLNNIVKLNDGSYAIIAEYGQILHSVDAGKTWVITETGYEGSFFGGIPMGTSGLTVFGLRGTAYSNNDVQNPDGWEQVDSTSADTLLGGASTGAGTGIAVGSKGAVVLVSGNGARFSQGQNDKEDPLAAVLPVDGGFITVGAKGLQFLPAQ